ncbi:beta-galactosidase, partial [candidate division KSB1 bacterium]|nr:beta-galactosidase [candidate division KSB1 bacterium]
FDPDTTIVVRGSFELTDFNEGMEIKLFSKSLSMDQAVYINGHLIAEGIKREAPGQEFLLEHAILRPGRNVYAVIGPPLVKRHQWEELNTDPGVIRVKTPEPVWKRCAFNGLAQVIIQSTQQPGDFILTATGSDLKKSEMTIKSTAKVKI